MGRGRAPDDALGTDGRLGRGAARGVPGPRPLRRSCEALAHGGLRYVHVSAEAIAYLRETPGERLLCLAARAAHAPVTVPFAGLETLYGGDAAGGVLPADGPAFHVWRVVDG